MLSYGKKAGIYKHFREIVNWGMVVPQENYLEGFTLATIDDFMEIEMRVGTVLKAEPFLEAKKPAIKLEIDFGEAIGTKQSSAQITRRYEPEELEGRQVVGVVNFPPMRIAGYKSEVLVIGGVQEEDDVVLLRPDEPVANGTRIS